MGVFVKSKPVVHPTKDHTDELEGLRQEWDRATEHVAQLSSQLGEQRLELDDSRRSLEEERANGSFG